MAGTAKTVSMASQDLLDLQAPKASPEPPDPQAPAGYPVKTVATEIPVCRDLQDRRVPQEPLDLTAPTGQTVCVAGTAKTVSTEIPACKVQSEHKARQGRKVSPALSDHTTISTPTRAKTVFQDHKGL